MNKDTIYRQDAIDAIKKSRFLVDAMEKVIKLPPAEPKMGQWKTVGMYTVECSECKARLHELEYTNFCPNCGAYMRGICQEGT